MIWLLPLLGLSLALDPALFMQYKTIQTPESQYNLGFLYSTNYGNVTGKGAEDYATGLLYYTFSGLSEYVPAQMTIGYRNWVGIGVKKSCADSLSWYKSAAEASLRVFNAGPAGGRHLPPAKIRLTDREGGVYGIGVGGAAHNEWEDLLEFHLFHAERGDPTFMYRLGRLYYNGDGTNGGVRGGFSKLSLDSSEPGYNDGLAEGGRDFYNARRWFGKVCKGVWVKDPPKEIIKVGKDTSPSRTGEQRIGYYDEKKDIKLVTDESYMVVAGLSAGFLGRMYLRGEGGKVDYAKAFLWLMRGSTQGDRESRNALGIMFRDGLGVARDLAKAKLLFSSAAQQDLAEAQVNLGKYHLGIGDSTAATSYFEAAIRLGDPYQSYFYLATILSQSTADHCPTIVSFFKTVAERGDWTTEVWWEAERAFKKGEEEKALLGYWIMAERGYEPAQNNLAWILDPKKNALRIPFLDKPVTTSNETDRLALTYWTRSASQDNVDALLKMGDYYFSGIGTELDLAKAVGFYRSAANSHVSAMAMWNLGWMHEVGHGVVQDFNLAKRYYDLSLETSSDAYFPVHLSLLSLYTRSLYHYFFVSGSPNSPTPLELFPTSPPKLPLLKPIIPPVKENWNPRRVWNEIQKKWNFQPMELPIENREDRQRAIEVEGTLEVPIDWRTRDREEDEDYFDFDAGEGTDYSTLAIIGLCIILAWLINFRQNRIAPEQQNQPRRQAPVQPNRGPPPAVVDEPGGQF